MKRVTLALLGLFCAATLMAQNGQPTRTQRGNATQEIQAEGLSAAHNNIPLGSKVRVKNPANGREIEVTVVEQMPASTRRIIDISPAAALALDLRSGGPVEITPLFQPQDYPSFTEAETGTDTDKSPLPFNVTINNYIANSEKPLPPKNGQDIPAQSNSFTRNITQDPVIEPDIPNLSAQVPNPVVELSAVQTLIQPEAPPPEAPAPPPVQEAPPPPPPPPEAPPPPAPAAKPSPFTKPPVYNIRIIPDRLPDPNTTKVYRLLVGTYPGLDSAFPIYQQLQAAGFQVEQEQSGEMCRVFAAGILASQVYYAAQRLGAIGFEQVWVHE